jgi:hypothetical protein
MFLFLWGKRNAFFTVGIECKFKLTETEGFHPVCRMKVKGKNMVVQETWKQISMFAITWLLGISTVCG